MNFTTVGQFVGCIGIAYFVVRGLLATMYDFTAWTLRRNGIDPD